MNRAMALPDPEEFWAAHREGTRHRILVAFTELLQTENPSKVSMPSVARRAGVSVRTLYRYFRNKDELMRGAETWFDERARDAVGRRQLDLESFPEFLGYLWHDFMANLDAVRAQHVSAGGRELRSRRLVQHRREVLGGLPDAVPEERRGDVADIIVALGSSSMFLELVDRQGHCPDHAADLISHVIELVAADAARAGHDHTENGA